MLKYNNMFLYENTTVLKIPKNLIICESPENYNQLLENDKRDYAN